MTRTVLNSSISQNLNKTDDSMRVSFGYCAVAVAALPTFNIFAETATEAEQRQWQRSSSQLTTVKHVPHRLRHANDVSAHTPPKRRRRPKLQKQQQQENKKRKEKKPQLERFTVGKQRQRKGDA